MSSWIFPPVDPYLGTPHLDFWDNLVFLELLAANATAIAFICIAFKRRR